MSAVTVANGRAQIFHSQIHPNKGSMAFITLYSYKSTATYICLFQFFRECSLFQMTQLQHTYGLPSSHPLALHNSRIQAAALREAAGISTNGKRVG